MNHTINSGMIVLGLILANSGAQAGTITTYTDRPTFNAAVGSTTTDDFGPTFAFPISTGVLNSTTNLATSSGGPILPGLIQPGVTYSTPLDAGFFFNIDAGGGFAGGLLDGGLPADGDPLTVTFASPIAAFGFDTNSLMGNNFSVTINFASGPAFLVSPIATTSNLSFFGFQSSATDILSARIIGDGSMGFDFALDNFSVGGNPGNPSAVPEPAALLLLSSGLMGLMVRRRKQRGCTAN